MTLPSPERPLQPMTFTGCDFWVFGAGNGAGGSGYAPCGRCEQCNVPAAHKQAITLTDEEAEELYRYTRYEYLSPNTYPALTKLVSRLTTKYGPRV